MLREQTAMRASLRLGVALLALFASSAASGAPAAVHIALREQPNALNPLVSTQYDENYLTEAIFSGLTKLDDHARAVPDLAREVPTPANGGISPDGKTVTYHLRPDARWQDGVAVSAADVVFTFAKIRDPAVPYVSRTLYDAVERLEARDAHTVVVHLRHPEPDAPYEMFVAGQNGEIVPKHLLEHETDMLHAPFNAAPVGSGAYRVERWDRGSALVLRANPAYFGGPPAIDRLVVDFISDSNTRALALRTHDVALARIEPVNIAAVAATRDARVVSVVQPTLVYLHFQLEKPPFDDLRVRRALSLVIDRTQIAAKTFLGQAEPATGIVPPQSPFVTVSVPRGPDAAAAKRALDAAGWTAGPDGMRRRGGVPLAIVLTCIAGDAANTRTAVALQSAWKALGIDTALRPLPYNLLYAPDGALARGDFGIALVSYSFAITPDRTEFLATAALPPHGYNYARLRDPVLDGLMADAHASIDTMRRKQLYAQIEARVANEVPVYPVIWEKAVFGVSTRIDGIRPEPVNSDLWNVTQWRVREDEK